jgi:hypothetical protein
MLRRFSAFVLIVAALIAVEPLLHNHPLQQKDIPHPCAVCATGIAPLPSATPTIAAPQIIVYAITALAVTFVTTGTSLTLAPRAPPA